MSEFRELRCDGCHDIVERFADAIRVYWPRRSRDGMSLEPLIHDYCSALCLHVVLKPRRVDEGPHRPWCCSIAVGAASPGCDCLLVDDPRDNRELAEVEPW